MDRDSASLSDVIQQLITVKAVLKLCTKPTKPFMCVNCMSHVQKELQSSEWLPLEPTQNIYILVLPIY